MISQCAELRTTSLPIFSVESGPFVIFSLTIMFILYFLNHKSYFQETWTNISYFWLGAYDSNAVNNPIKLKGGALLVTMFLVVTRAIHLCQSICFVKLLEDRDLCSRIKSKCGRYNYTATNACRSICATV